MSVTLQEVRDHLVLRKFENYSYSPKDLFTFTSEDRIVQVQIFDELTTPHAVISSYGFNEKGESVICFKSTLMHPKAKTVGKMISIAEEEAEAFSLYHTVSKLAEKLGGFMDEEHFTDKTIRFVTDEFCYDVAIDQRVVAYEFATSKMTHTRLSSITK